MTPASGTHDTSGLTWDALTSELRSCCEKIKNAPRAKSAVAAAIHVYGDLYLRKLNRTTLGVCCFCLYIDPECTHPLENWLNYPPYELGIVSKEEGDPLFKYLNADKDKDPIHAISPGSDPRHRDWLDRFEKDNWEATPGSVTTILDEPLLAIPGVGRSVLVPFKVKLGDACEQHKTVKAAIEVYLAPGVSPPSDNRLFVEAARTVEAYVERNVQILGLHVMSRLSRRLLRAGTYSDRLKDVNIAAAMATAWHNHVADNRDVPRGSYSHIRRYVPGSVAGARGTLTMISNAGYSMDAEKIVKGRRRAVPAGECNSPPEEPTGNGTNPEEKSVSLVVFMKAFCCSTGKKSDGSTQSDDASFEKMIAKNTVIEMVKGDYAVVEGRQESTRSQLTVPILDGSMRPIGVLNINSNRYGWINPLWLPVAIELAKRAALVIEQQSGYALVRRSELTLSLPDPGYAGKIQIDIPHEDYVINPLKPESLEDKRLLRVLPKHFPERLLELYANEAVYPRLTIDPLNGFSLTTKTYRVGIHGRNQKSPINRQVVRFFPEAEHADREITAYEMYVEPYLSTRHYCPKINARKDGNTAAISYAWAAQPAGARLLTLEERISKSYENCCEAQEHNAAHEGLADCEHLGKLIGSLYSQVLRPWLDAGEGIFKNEDIPNPRLPDLYQRPGKDTSPPELLSCPAVEKLSDADFFDMLVPGLFALEDFDDRARESKCIKTLVDAYLAIRREASDKITRPRLAICHGDLNSRNILTSDAHASHEIWIIDFDKIHRGHAYQDFARLETYIVDLFLNRHLEHGLPDDRLKYWPRAWYGFLKGFLPDLPGASHTDKEMLSTIYNSMERQHSVWVTYMVALITFIRRQAFAYANALTDFDHDSTAETRYCVEYYFALLCQYLDWISHPAPTTQLMTEEQKKSAEETYQQDCVRLSQVASWMAVEPLMQLLNIKKL